MQFFYGSFINQILVLSFLELMRNIQSVLPRYCEFYDEEFLSITGRNNMSDLSDVNATSLGTICRLFRSTCSSQSDAWFRIELVCFDGVLLCNGSPL